MGWVDTTRLTFLMRLRDRSDRISWDVFHERYGELIYRYARAYGASPEDAEDVVQEVELYLLKALDGFEYDAQKGRFRAYLRTAVVHVMGREATLQARRLGALLDPRKFDYVTAQKQADEDRQWDHEWRMHCLRNALRGLAGEFEAPTIQAFQLYVISGRPAAEVAATLAVGEATVYQAKSRILKALRARLGQLDPLGDV